MIKKINLNENLFHFLNIIMYTLNILCFFFVFYIYIFCKFYTFKFLDKCINIRNLVIKICLFFLNLLKILIISTYILIQYLK